MAQSAKTTDHHPADSHDLIRVHGARVNNLKDISVELPKRRLTVFTGVSGSGKSSLVFGTVAAESQRLINETYSAFVQGFMPSLARPDVDVLDGLTTAIIVDQERMGSDPRSTVGTATDANAMLRILFSRLGKPHIGSAQAFSFNVASISGAGAVTVQRGSQPTKERREFSITGGMCPRCEGRGSINDIDLTALYDDSKSLNEGALTIPGYSMDGWYGRIYRGCGFLDPDKPIRKYTKKELHDLLHKEATKLKVDGVNLTYLGLIPQIQKSYLSKDIESMQPHVRTFVERIATFTTCPDCDGTRLSALARSSKIKGKNIAEVCAMQISDLAEWVSALEEPSAAPLLEKLRHSLDSFVQIGLGYLSLDRPAGTLSGDDHQHTERDIEVYLLQVMGAGTSNFQAGVRYPHGFLQRGTVIEVPPGNGAAGSQLRHRALEAHSPTAGARTGSQIDDMVRDVDGLRFVLHHQHGVALVAQLQQQTVHPLDVMRMQAYGRLVEHIGDVGKRGAEVANHLGALSFSTG